MFICTKYFVVYLWNEFYPNYISINCKPHLFLMNLFIVIY